MLLALERRTVDVENRSETVEPVRPTAMMDVSDGLALDLGRLCAASGVGCVVEERLLPVDGAARRIARERGDRESALALGGGEDFELLFTIAERDVETLTAAAVKAHVSVVPVGRIAHATDGLRLIAVDGTDGPLGAAGFDHFVNPPPRERSAPGGAA
jgi:thiamine-monophosphate kinase